jgi:hypothetical protein
MTSKIKRNRGHVAGQSGGKKIPYAGIAAASVQKDSGLRVVNRGTPRGTFDIVQTDPVYPDRFALCFDQVDATTQLRVRASVGRHFG